MDLYTVHSTLPQTCPLTNLPVSPHPDKAAANKIICVGKQRLESTHLDTERSKQMAVVFW